jgi:hypothetical protein
MQLGEWQEAIGKLLGQAAVVTGETYRQKWDSFSKPVLVECSDKQEYVVKARVIGRGTSRMARPSRYARERIQTWRLSLPIKP